jgi:hypothetical protein
MHDVDAVAQRDLLRELRVELVARLRVVGDEIDLAPEQPAGRVDLLDGELDALELLRAEGLQRPRRIRDRAELDGGPLRECETG